MACLCTQTLRFRTCRGFCCKMTATAERAVMGDQFNEERGGMGVVRLCTCISFEPIKLFHHSVRNVEHDAEGNVAM